MRGFYAVNAGHTNVEKHNVRFVCDRHCQRLLAVCGFTDNLVVLKIREDLP
jgi:hypothetical protein